MNKQNLWFLSLFSIILILGVYYITLPSEIFNNMKSNTVNKEVDIKVSEEDNLIALRVERDEKIATTMSELQDKITSSSSTSEEKNSVSHRYRALKEIKKLIEESNENE